MLGRSPTLAGRLCFTLILIFCGCEKSTGINCTFDSSMCGWRQSSDDHFDWTLWTGPTTANYTGPPGDHTTGKGQYVYANAFYPRVPKDRARLVFSPFTGQSCLTLHFYMHGPAVDELRLLVDGKIVLSIVGEKGDRWMTAQAQINGSDSEVVLEAVVGGAWQGDIAVDDILISEQCNVSGCPSLLGLQNASVTCSHGNSIGSTCNVSCLAGYNLFGPASQTCLTSGVWSGSLSRCADVQVRLVGGNTSLVGQVEIAVNGVWGTICDDDWNVESASVVCKMLGLPQASAAPGNSAFGDGTGRIWLDSVECTGNETSIVECGHKGWGAQDDCDHGEDAGVICGPVTAFGVRLAEGSTSNEGRVEVSINGIWGTVCDDSWSLENAKVVCRMLGLPQATAATLGKSFGSGTGPVWMDDVKCAGKESSLLLCPRADLGVKNCAHFEDAGVICGPPTIPGQVNAAFQRPTSQSSTFLDSDSSLVVDGNDTTCSLSQEEAYPWWRVDLEKELYIHTVKIIYNTSAEQSDLFIGWNNNSNSSSLHSKCVQDWKVSRESNIYVFSCRPPQRHSSVSVFLAGVSKRLSLCEVAVYAVESANDTLAILREVWFGAVSIEDDPILKFNQAFSQAPHTLGLLQQFHIAPDYGTKYGQRLSACVQPTESGLYTFQLACEDECELWVEEEEEKGLGISEATKMNRLWIKLTRRTGPLQWDKYPDVQYSKEIYLSKCIFYSLEAFSRDGYREGHLSVGWRLPDGRFERPIPGGNLRWILPGERDLAISLNGMSGNSSVKFGSTLTITALYHYCCHGMLCPNCPISLRFLVLGRSFVVDEELHMSCKDKQFNLTINAHVEPGNYSTEARYFFTNDTTLEERRISLGFVQVEVSMVQRCSFDTGLCPGWKTSGSSILGDWRFSDNKTDSPGGFAYTNGSNSAKMESPTLPQEETGNGVNLCLTLSYLMPKTGRNNITVWLQSRDSLKMLMSLAGYHGENWSAAQVSWTSIENSKIVFESHSTETAQISVAIDDVQITTEKCETEPGYAQPGYTCSSVEFQCDNGECVTASLRCDGDVACRDKSDEKDCKCLSHQFSCPSGRCVSVTSLCDGSKDCEDGSDEERCEKKCSDFQCVDGSCIPWSSTCNVAGKFCRDNTHSPQVCGSRSCSLENLACNTEDRTNSKCSSLRGYCTFANGLCGLMRDDSTDLRWTLGQGTTPSKDTGPSFDHTTLTREGRYIFIEASQRAPGDRARLISDWLMSNDSECLQFWYHMYGRDTGELNIYLKTNESEKLVWHQRGDQGDQWIFAQTTIDKLSSYRIILEGVVHDGPGGDIALDDISLFDGECAPVIKEENPGCSFDLDTCNWRGHKDWIISSDPLKDNWKSVKGGHLHLQGGSNVKRTFYSPLFNTDSRGWRCVRFWYFSGGKYFKRTLELFIVNTSGGKPLLLWSHDQETMGWLFVQLPLHVNQSRVQLLFQGRKQQSQPVIAIDDVSFSKENCETISAATECYHYSVLNTADRLWTYADSGKMCDDELDFNRWYRFTGAAGNQMVTWCIPHIRCGARYPGWMNGSHPAPNDGVVRRHACFVLGDNCCHWKNKISVRNCGGFFVYKLAPPQYCNQRYCSRDVKGNNEDNTKIEWFGWKNLNRDSVQWRMTDLKQMKEHGIENNLSEDINQSLCYELHLPTNGSGHVTFIGNNQSSLSEMTTCLWVKTNQSKITVNYNVGKREGKIWATPVERNNTSLLVMMNDARVNTVNVTDGKWNHVCVTCTSESDTCQMYKNGALVQQALPDTDAISSEQQRSIVHEPAVLGKISGFNIWSMSKDSSEVSFMSYGGDMGQGDVISWSTVKNSIKGMVLVKTPTPCKEHRGPRLTIVNPHKEGIAVFVSTWMEWSANWYGSCLRFRYQMYGPGAQALRVYQRLPYNLSEHAIWVDSDNSSRKWKSGEVSIAAVSRHQILLKGIFNDRPGYIAVGGILLSKEYCQSTTAQSRQACSQNINAGSGFITSPYYPGYYTNNTQCTWRLTAPKGHVIRLEFLAFQLESNWTCSKDFVEVRDAEGDMSRVMGRYCGHTFPSFVETSSNIMTVTFSTDQETARTGFKAYYHSRKGRESSCIQNCPSGCTCSRLSNTDSGILLTCRGLVTSPTPLPLQTVAIMAGQNKISRVRKEDFMNLPLLNYLDLSNNVVLKISAGALNSLPSLQTIRLNGNFIKKVPVIGADGPRHLETLDLGENLIEKLEADAFFDISSLRVLGLRENKVTEIDDGAFSGLTNLTSLYLDGNQITAITKNTFKSLTSLETLFLHNNKLIESTIPRDVFSDMKNLRHLTLDSFILCCYAKETLQTVDCQSPEAALSSCEDLLKSSVIRLSIWLLGIVAVLGNALVIVWRACDTDENRIQSVLLTNLAVSDLIMGVYLLLIAIQDTRWKGEYFQHDLQWRAGVLCQLAGALSVLSSEVSVFMLAVITADRLVAVVSNVQFKRLTLTSAYAICVAVWLLGATVAFFPMFGVAYFESEDSTTYFGGSAVCIPLQLSSERRPGWEYSATFFIALNLAIFVFIVLAYIVIFTVVKKSARTAQTRNTRHEQRLAKRMTCIILTDFACWMPVIIIGILSLSGGFHDPEKRAYVWIAVFVLPVNSSINPILYTFSAASVKRKFLFWSRRVGEASPDVMWQMSSSKRRAGKHTVKGNSGSNSRRGGSDIPT